MVTIKTVYKYNKLMEYKKNKKIKFILLRNIGKLQKKFRYQKSRFYGNLDIKAKATVSDSVKLKCKKNKETM